jgi:hypothetical protein
MCAVGERRARNTGSRAIARLDPAPVSACYLQVEWRQLRQLKQALSDKR